MDPSLFSVFASRLGWAVIHSLWMGLAVAALLALALAVLRHRSAAARHAACLGALALLLGSFIASFGIGLSPSAATGKAASSTGMLHEQEFLGSDAAIANPSHQAASSDESGEVLPSFAAQSGRGKADEPEAIASNPVRVSWMGRLAPVVPWIGGAWMAGAAFMLLRRFGGWRRVSSLRRRGLSAASDDAQRSLAQLGARLGLRCKVRVMESTRALAPMLIGTLRPLILLPARTVTGLSAKELEAILAHELAHLARNDTWANLFQLSVETVLFYHPATWWIGRRTRAERECAADDLALQLCDGRLTYARALARVAELGAAPEPALGANSGSVLGRIRRVLGQPVKPEPAAGGWLFIVAAVAVGAALGPLQGQQAAPAVQVAAGESLQAAIDAAAPGAVIQLAEGEWKERVVITKPVTIEGAGWEKSRIVIDEPRAPEITAALAEVELLGRAAATPEEKQHAAAEWVRRIARPGVWVRDVEGVTLRKLRVQGLSRRGPRDGGTPSTLIYFQRAKASMTECAVIGPFGNGIQIADASDVEIRSTLVAAIWHNGIIVHGQIRGDDTAPAKLQLIDSEVRNVYHYGIAIGRGCDSTRVERCRISGTAWHGIRYDEASPLIAGNVIFQNARSGIYASGSTKATVRGNLFWKNEMGGMSCWFDNADTIEGNTFVSNLREGLLVVGAKPVVTRNIFWGNPVAIALSRTERRGSGMTAFGEPVLSANLFHDNPAAVAAGEEKRPLPEGSYTDDPRFADPAKLDFTLAADSPARAAGVGVAEPLAISATWPLLAEEKAIIPEGDTREFRFWTAPGGARTSKTAEELKLKSRTDAQGLLADAFQLDNAAKREAAIERIRALLTGTDMSGVRIGLAAFNSAQQVEFDKASFRSALRKLLASPEADIRAQALQGLAAIGESAEDLELAIGLLDDPSGEVRTALPGALKRLSAHGFTGKTGEAILNLLDRNDGKVTQAVWHAMWGTKISPELERRVVEASLKDDKGTGYSEVFYYALTVHLSKREPTVSRLIELTASSDTTNVAGRCLWGLLQGVEKDQQPRVAELALKVLAARSDEYMRRQASACLRAYGSAPHAEPLRDLLRKPGVTGEFKKELEATLATIEQR